MRIGKITLGQHVIERDVISVSAQVQPVDAVGHGQISWWRTLNGVEEDAELQRVTFAYMSPHDSGLEQALEHIQARLSASNPAILYLHCGHQSDTRSPILQHLVPLVGGGGPIFALRVENERAFQDAMIMAHALLSDHGQVLVLRDEIRRLGRKVKTASALTYEVLSRERVDGHPVMPPMIGAVLEARRVHS